MYPHVEIYGTPLKSVKNFTYLDSTIASDNIIDVGINNCIHAALEPLEDSGSMYGHKMVLVSKKCKVYEAIVF